MLVRDGYCSHQNLWCIFLVSDGYCIYLKKISQMCNTHHGPNNDTNPTYSISTKHTILLWIQYFVEISIAIVILFFIHDFLLYMRKIYLHLYIWCVIRIALCISFSICKGQYAKEAETFHQCTTIKVGANIFRRYVMNAKDKEGVWEDVNFHGSISSFKVYFKTHGGRRKDLCLMSLMSG